MEPKAHHIIIGLFTLVIFGAALLFALWLGKASANQEWAYYQVGFDHPVGGLAKGNPVLYSGVPVGEVANLTLAPENPAYVRVLVRVDENIHLKQDTRAELVLANITGSMSVQFTGGSPGSPRLQGSQDNPPLIQADPSVFSSLLSNGKTMLTKAEQLLTRMNSLLSPDNLDNASAILANTHEATESLLANREAMVALLEQFDKAAIRAEEAAIKVSATSDHARTVLSDEISPVLTSVTQTLQTLQPTLERFDRLTADNENALAAGFQGFGEVAPALRELRNTLRTLNAFSQRLEEDPLQTIWGGTKIQEFER